jgi:hypothetical protein
MATLHVNDETYNRLARQAAVQNTTVEGLVQPMLERAAEGAPRDETRSPTTAEREKALDEWMALVQQRANRYAPGFVVDDSRESIYEGRGER